MCSQIKNECEEKEMEQNTSFTYRYSAKEQKEVQEIRKKYLPESESKLDELKRLDRAVEKSGTVLSLVIGIIGCLIFGTGMCLAMNVLGSGQLFMILGIIVGIVGAAVMIAAYPMYKKMSRRAKAKYAPRILELTDELSEKNEF